jgi:hypothetical protein
VAEWSLMIEQLKPLTDVLNERAKNPIIGGFVFESFWVED